MTRRQLRRLRAHRLCAEFFIRYAGANVPTYRQRKALPRIRALARATGFVANSSEGQSNKRKSKAYRRFKARLAFNDERIGKNGWLGIHHFIAQPHFDEHLNRPSGYIMWCDQNKGQIWYIVPVVRRPFRPIIPKWQLKTQEGWPK